MANPNKPSRKELLKTEDEFLSLSAKAVMFFQDHKRHFQYVGIGIVAVIVVFLAATTYLRHANKKGQEAYNLALAAFSEVMSADSKPEKAVEAEKLFTVVVDDHGMSRAARVALPQIAYLKFMDKKYDDAIALYREFMDEMSGEREYEALAGLALASCYEAKGDLNTAIDTLAPLVNQPHAPFRETAMFNLARLYRLNDDSGKAQDLIRKFVEEFEDSPLAPMAKARL